MVFSILSCSFLKNMYHRNSALLRSRSPQLPVVVLDAFLPVPSPSSPSSAHSHAQLIGVFVCAVMCVACVVYRRYGGHKEKLKQARTGDEQRRNSPLKQRTGVQTFPFSRGMDCFSERRKMMTQRKPNMQAKKALFWGGRRHVSDWKIPSGSNYLLEKVVGDVLGWVLGGLSTFILKIWLAPYGLIMIYKTW